MQKDQVLLSLDAGGGGGRCLIVDAHGNQLAAAYQEWQFHEVPGVPMGTEFDPSEVWSVFAKVAREAVVKAGVSPEQVAGIGCTSIRDGVVFVGADGQPVYAGTNRDARCIALGAEVQRKWGDWMPGVTGRVPLGLDAATHLLWYKRFRPQEFTAITRVMMVSDWMVYKLTGEYSADPSNASSSQLFDVNTCTWSTKIAEALEAKPDIFPTVLFPGEVAGRLSAAAAADLGLQSGIPVSAGVGDSQAGCLGCGAIRDGETTVIAGTTIPVQTVVDTPVHDTTRHTWLGTHALPNRWVVESNGGMAGTIYAAVKAEMFPPETSYTELEKLMEAEVPGQVMAFMGTQVADMSKLAFPPMSAIMMPSMMMSAPLTRVRLARAVLENIAYAVKGNIEQNEQVCGAPSTAIFVCGGLSRSRLFAQILADVCEREVSVPSIRETTGLGACIAAAVAAGVYTSVPEAVKVMTHTEFTASPQADSVKRYKPVVRKWQTIAGNLAKIG
jgi:autoinducer 2 (AI-2) kinase